MGTTLCGCFRLPYPAVPRLILSPKQFLEILASCQGWQKDGFWIRPKNGTNLAPSTYPKKKKFKLLFKNYGKTLSI